MTTMALMCWALVPAHAECDRVPDSVVVVRATGIGYPPPRVRNPRARLMARRAAEVSAVRNLARRLGHGDHATLHGFRYVSTRYLVDGSVEVTVEKTRQTVRKVCRVDRRVHGHNDGAHYQRHRHELQSGRFVHRADRHQVSHHRAIRLHSRYHHRVSRPPAALHRATHIRQQQRHVRRR